LAISSWNWAENHCARERSIGKAPDMLFLLRALPVYVGIAHAIETLALIVGDLFAGAVGFTRGLDPDVRVDAVLVDGFGPLAQARAFLIAPVAGVKAAVDAAFVHQGIGVGRGTGRGRAARAAPAVARSIDDHPDGARVALRNEHLAEVRREGQLVGVLVPVEPLAGRVFSLTAKNGSLSTE
jgi:hypothetical protein